MDQFFNNTFYGDLTNIKQIAFYIYCLIIPFLIALIGICITYIKINKGH
jgi:hypothetical protein